jgi:hypothetical protein
MQARALVATSAWFASIALAGCAQPACRCDCARPMGLTSPKVGPAAETPPPPPAQAPTALASCAFQAAEPGCTPIAVKGASGSRRFTEGYEFEKAVDGDRCTSWNAGEFPPQEIVLDLGAATMVRALLLLPAMTPDGPVVLELSASLDGVSWSHLQRGRADLRSEIPFTVRLPQSTPARWLRVRTLSSPSWVAWYEIVPLRCG